MDSEMILKSMAPHEADEVKRLIGSLGLESLFSSENLKDIGKDAATKLLSTLREKVLPLLRDKIGAPAAMVLSACLDQLQAKINAL